MTSREFRERLARGVAAAGVVLPSDRQVRELETYLALLAKWNEKINLTALPLKVPTDETFDRLFAEPLIASRYVQEGSGAIWFDLGSGGGSPAVPLKIVRPALELIMIEAKTRKAAFLREVVRSVPLTSATVENSRIEEVASRRAGVARLVTMRAVRLDSALATSAAELLASDGKLFVFRADARSPHLPGFEHIDTVVLPGWQPSFVVIYKRVFHVEQSR